MQSIAPTRLLATIVLALTALTLAACGGAETRKAKHLAKGQAYLAAANYEKARVEFQNALQISPVDPEARFENGVVDEKLGKTREAAQFFQSAIDVKPDHVGARIGLARIYLFAGAPDKTLELVQPALAKNPDNAELLTLRAAAKVQKKELGEALGDAERAVQLEPSNEDAVSALAGIYVADKSTDKAQTLLENSIKRIPATVNLRLALGQLYASGNRPADVERILLEIIHLEPAVAAHRIRLAQFYARQNQLDAAEQTMRDGIKAIPADRDLKLSLVDFLSAHRSPETAERELQAMIAAAPTDVELKFAQARFYVGNHQADRAEKVLREVIDAEKLDAAGIAARDRLANLLAQRDDVKGTQQLIDEVLAKSPRDTDALILRGDIALANRDPKSAIVDLRTVLRDQPNAIGVLRTLARAHLANGEPAIAEETMRRALDANPKDAGIRLDLAQLLAQLGKLDQAKAMLEGLVKDQPNNVAALDTLFRVSAGTKDYDTARMASDAMVASEPKSPVGYVYQGIVAEQTNHAADALRLYTHAAELQPDAFEPLQAETRLLVQANRQAEALQKLDALIAANPKNAFAPDIKGDVLLNEKDFSGAQAAFKVAIARAPAWWPAYRGLATAQFAAKDTDGAVATLKGAEGAVSQPDLAGIDLATYYERVGKPEDAMREYDGIVKRSPQSDVAANNLAMLLVTYGKDAASIDRAKTLTARFADSTNPSFLDTYGWVLFKHGEAAASVPVLQKVVAQEPNAPVAFYHLGMAQSQAGAKAQALDNLTKAVKSGAKFSGLDEAKATLDQLANLPAGAAPKT
jgi:predicted Zn-dependent protease